MLGNLNSIKDKNNFKKNKNIFISLFNAYLIVNNKNKEQLNV